MIKQIFKQIWTEHRQNSWILIELAAVFFFLLVTADFMWIRIKNYSEPKGFDIEDTFVLKLKTLNPNAPDYVRPQQDPNAIDYLSKEDIALKSLDDLMSIINRIKTYPDVMLTSLSIHSAPYSMGGFWNRLKTDTTQTQSMRKRVVTPSYFEVFRIHTADGKPIIVEEAGYNQIVLTKDVAELLCGSVQNAIGSEIIDTNEDLINKVVSVSNLIKKQEFDPYEGAFFEILSTVKLQEWAKENNITDFNLCVRVKPGSAKHFQDNFEIEMSDRLRENNLYVASVIPSAKLRDDIVGKAFRESILMMIYVLGFVLIIVFLGVFGTFWLRTSQRRGEIGIRMAMGASKNTIRYSMIVEGLCLLLISAIPALIVYLNLLNADVLDTARLQASFERIMIAFLSSLIVIVIIIVSSIYQPANQAASVPPVEALRDE